MRVHEDAVARLACEQGVALIVALMSMLLLSALGLALTLTTITETSISGNYRSASEALYAADAAIELVMQELQMISDWKILTSGGATSAFIDGSPGIRKTAAGTFNLTTLTDMVNCGGMTDCGSGVANTAVWRLHAHGPVAGLLPAATIDSLTYVVVWVAGDQSGSDVNPPDDTPASDSQRAVIRLLAHAYGPSGIRRAVEVTVEQTRTAQIERDHIDAVEDEDSGPSPVRVRILSWRELR